MASSTTLDLQQLADPAVRADPYPVLHQLREASPLVRMGGWLVVAGRHADCAAVLRHPHASAERYRSVLSPPALRRGGLSFLVRDPPDHTRLRRLVSTAFTPRVVAGLRPRIAEVVDGLFATIAATGRMDVVADLAYPLPVQIISELLGVPVGDRTRFLSWSARLARALDPQVADPDPHRLAEGIAARKEFDGYLTGLIAMRRARPADDLLSRLIAAGAEGDRLTADELLAACVLILVAGHETTANLIANAVLALLRHPDQLALLRARPELVDACVEETLRYDAPVQLTTRAARGALPVGSAEVPDGGLVVLLLAAAGRDPGLYPDPDRFDITRRTGTHIAFGAGAHFCLGAGLARLQAAVALRAFALRVVAPRLAGTGVEYKANINLRGPARLPVEFADIRPSGFVPPTRRSG